MLEQFSIDQIRMAATMLARLERAERNSTHAGPTWKETSPFWNDKHRVMAAPRSSVARRPHAWGLAHLMPQDIWMQAQIFGVWATKDTLQRYLTTIPDKYFITTKTSAGADVKSNQWRPVNRRWGDRLGSCTSVTARIIQQKLNTTSTRKQVRRCPNYYAWCRVRRKHCRFSK